jgi:predicted alpha/beta-fold hydrolase
MTGSSKEFQPHRLLRNPHAMTIATAFWRRRFSRLPASVTRLFQTDPQTKVRGECHWHGDPRRRRTLVLLHGLEGSSESGYMLGTAERAWVAGYNVVRLNQRNCGGTEQLTPTVYNSGMSGDIRAVTDELIEQDRLPEIYAAGFSMGGNLVLKMIGETGDGAPAALRAVVAVAPALDLAACADAIAEPQNFLYEQHFVRQLKERIALKARLFPDLYKFDGLHKVHTVRQYDDAVTAPLCGFRDASDYYARCSAGQWLQQIARPTLILAAEDDPIVPFSSIERAGIERNPKVKLVSTRYGGHCAFLSRDRDDRFWSEARIVEFCQQN